MAIPLKGAASGMAAPATRLLHRAFAAIGFSPVMKIGEPSGIGIADFQDGIRKQYPDVELEYEQLVHVHFDEDGFKPTLQQLPVWKFRDVARHWTVSLTTQSIALEAEEGYTNRLDFSARLRALSEAVGRSFSPTQSTRLGVRYINTSDPERIHQICTADLISITGAEGLIQADLMWRFEVEEGVLILRSGILAPGTTHEPKLLDPVGESTWLLDIDVINEEGRDFEPDFICPKVDALMDRARAIYGWALRA